MMVCDRGRKLTISIPKLEKVFFFFFFKWTGLLNSFRSFRSGGGGGHDY